MNQDQKNSKSPHWHRSYNPLIKATHFTHVQKMTLQYIWSMLIDRFIFSLVPTDKQPELLCHIENNILSFTFPIIMKKNNGNNIFKF